MEKFFVTWEIYKKSLKNPSPGKREMHSTCTFSSAGCMVIAGGRDDMGQLLSDVWVLKYCNNNDDDGNDDDHLQIIDNEEKKMEGIGKGEESDQMVGVKSNANANVNSISRIEIEIEKEPKADVTDLRHDEKPNTLQYNDSSSCSSSSSSNNDSGGGNKRANGDIMCPSTNSNTAVDSSSSQGTVGNIGEGTERAGTVLIHELILTADEQIWQKKDVESSGGAGNAMRSVIESVSTARTDVSNEARNQDPRWKHGLVWERVVGLDLPTARCAHTSAISGGVIYIYGGFTGE